MFFQVKCGWYSVEEEGRNWKTVPERRHPEGISDASASEINFHGKRCRRGGTELENSPGTETPGRNFRRVSVGN